MTMKPHNPESLISWEQLRDLLGDQADVEQQGMLADMWREMRADLEVSWARLGENDDEAELRRGLHALRGLVAMWGLAAVARRMYECETDPESAERWRREKAELTVWLERSVAEIENRFPGLAG